MRVERMNRMEQYIVQQQTVSIEGLAEHFNVSVNTVRRDLNALVQNGKVRKVYGGVQALRQQETAPVASVPVPVRSRLHCEEKKTIGALASTLVKDNSAIFLDSGSTTPYILEHLAKRVGVTVITYSLPAMSEAAEYPNLSMISLGGVYHPETASFVGISTIESLSRIGMETVFMAATGVSLTRGLTNTHMFEAEIKRSVVQRCDRIVLMADHSKFDHASIVTFCDFDKVSAVVTDKRPSDEFLEAMERSGTQLLCP